MLPGLAEASGIGHAVHIVAFMNPTFLVAHYGAISTTRTQIS